MSIIDNFLNSITMYRLLLYYLIGLLLVALGFSFFGIFSFNPFELIFSAAFILLTCFLTNWVFAKTFEVATNFESIYISSLILMLIIYPAKSLHDIPFIFWVSVWAASSKFIFAINKKHLFNPAALAVVLVASTLGGHASWWVGTPVMLPFSLLGLLIVRKIRRSDLVFYFTLCALLVTLALSFSAGKNPFTTLQKAIFDTPLIFFACIMLTEPLTTPPTKILQTIYGIFVGILFSPQFHIGSFYTTPEIALVLGNIFSYIVSPKQKLILKLKQILKTGPDLFDFIFEGSERIAFVPGQYMEWTLGGNPDSRGNRRYFTLSSSPTESDVRIGVKFYPKPSYFKKTMATLKLGDKIVASQLAGDFTIPKDPNKKLVFIAGGIGVTPFRSIIKYLLDKNEKRDVILFYSAKLVSEFVYADVFDQAQKQIGLKTIYCLTDTTQIPQNWQGKTGFIDEALIEKEVPDFKQRTFYLSGPHAMVTAFEKTLSKIGVPGSQIKTDYFPGYS